jgi:hypothetical protein
MRSGNVSKAILKEAFNAFIDRTRGELGERGASERDRVFPIKIRSPIVALNSQTLI